MRPKPERRKRPPGRPSKLSRGKVRAIIQLIEEGQFLKEACAAGQVSRSGFYRWLEKNPEFRDPLKAALESQRTGFKEDAIARIRKAFDKDWKAAAWYLERNFPSEFGRIRLEHANVDGGPVKTEAVSPEELANIDRAMEAHYLHRAGYSGPATPEPAAAPHATTP